MFYGEYTVYTAVSCLQDAPCLGDLEEEEMVREEEEEEEEEMVEEEGGQVQK